MPTDDFGLFFLVVLPPTSPTANTPSEAGSQDSDGAVGPRYRHIYTNKYPQTLYLLFKLSHFFPSWIEPTKWILFIEIKL